MSTYRSPYGQAFTTCHAELSATISSGTQRRRMLRANRRNRSVLAVSSVRQCAESFDLRGLLLGIPDVLGALQVGQGRAIGALLPQVAQLQGGPLVPAGAQ
ncbi:MAG: hypothetical protein IT360_27415 [Gemmatimonadaceae bacterium]|nr:hypothetical protein [Gemmatimonadaceae bacterium]